MCYTEISICYRNKKLSQSFKLFNAASNTNYLLLKGENRVHPKPSYSFIRQFKLNPNSEF